jgi:DNA-binding NarL/FixJ family response regulator
MSEATRSPIRVLIVALVAATAELLAGALAGEPGLEVVAAFAGWPPLVWALAARPDVLLADYATMALGGAEALRAELPSLTVVAALPKLDTAMQFDCIRGGAVGCVPASAPPGELGEAIRRAHAGEVLFPPELLRAFVGSLGTTPPAFADHPD